MTSSLLLLRNRASNESPPLLDLDFTSGTLPEGVTFSRASTGRYVDVNGILQTADVNAARFSYDPVTHEPLGLLYEPEAQNIHTNSLATLPSTLRDVTINSTSIPFIDGTSTALELLESATEQRHYIYAAETPMSFQTTYTSSVYLKAGTESVAQIAIHSSLFDPASHINVDLSTGEVVAQAGAFSNVVVQNAGNGWYRVAVTYTTTSGGYYYGIAILFTGNNPNAGRLPYYQGTGLNMYASGVQVEAVAVATSYIMTNGSAVTRYADQLGFTVPEGVSGLRYLFDDDSTQDVAALPGSYTVPTTLARAFIKKIRSL